MKRVILLIATSLGACSIFGQDFVHEGIAYSVINGENVEVTALPDGEKYTGEIHITDSFIIGEEEPPLSYGETSDNHNQQDPVIYKVVRVADGAFRECTGITKMELPYSVKEIGKEAFAGCTNLVEITIPNNLEKIDDRAFANCRINFIGIPSGLKEIGNQVFYGLNANDISLESTYLTNFGEETFTNSTIKRISLPENLISIPANTFSGCEELEYVSFGNCLTEIGENAFKGCKSITALTLPASLKTIDENAFSDTDINSLSFTGMEAPEFKLSYICNDKIPALVTFREEALASMYDWCPELFTDKVKFCISDVFELPIWQFPGNTEGNYFPYLAHGVMSPAVEKSVTLIDRGSDLCMCVGSITGCGMKFFINGVETNPEYNFLFEDSFYMYNGNLMYVADAFTFIFDKVSADTDIKIDWGESGVNAAESKNDGIIYDYCTGKINSPGKRITVFNTSGTQVAHGFGSVNTVDLGKGLYIVSTSTNVSKIIVH